jgi:hypothetical protein
MYLREFQVSGPPVEAAFLLAFPLKGSPYCLVGLLGMLIDLIKQTH